MAHEIHPGLFWIQECGPHRGAFVDDRNTFPEDWYEPGRDVHIPQNAFLLKGRRSLLFDTLSPAAGDQILDELEGCLQGEGLDYLVVSHPDVPHAGNTARILRAHPEATLVAPDVGSTHALYHLEDARKAGPGDEIELGGHTVRFHEATFLDAPMSIWMSETKSGTLFPVDWLGFPHMDGECGKLTGELEAEVSLSRLIEFHGRVLFWHAYVDVAKVHAAIDALTDRVEIEAIAPAHGLFIRDAPLRYVALVKEAVEAIRERGRVGTLG